MWVCLNNAFLSIVAVRMDSRRLLVRARRPGDLERIFPSMVGQVEYTPQHDYAYRCVMDRQLVAAALLEAAMDVDYPNFKDSVEDRQLHDAYLSFWSTMHSLQTRLRQAGRPRTWDPDDYQPVSRNLLDFDPPEDYGAITARERAFADRARRAPGVRRRRKKSGK